MKQPTKIGLLGCGVITQRILPGLLRICEDTGAQLTAICDVAASNLDAIQKIAGARDISRHSDLEDMLAQASMDAVLIATPIALHPAHVSAVLKSGRHVYTHKTLASGAERCRALAAEAEKGGLHLAASPGQVLLPAYARAREILQSGALGPLVSADACTEAAPHRYEDERADEDPAPGQPFSWEWYHSEARGGGPLDDMLVYPLAFLTEVLPAPTAAAVRSRLVVPNIRWRDRVVTADADDVYAGLVMFGEIPVTVRASFSANGGLVPWGLITLRGTQACLEIEKTNDFEYRLHITRNGEKPAQEAHAAWSAEESDKYGVKECHVLRDIREFLLAIRDGRDVTGATATNAARVADVLAMIKASARQLGEWAYGKKDEYA